MSSEQQQEKEQMKAEMEQRDVKGSRSLRWSSKCFKDGWSNERRNDMRLSGTMTEKTETYKSFPTTETCVNI